jgi:N-acetylglucosaminyl-diphospho-decaprenol L-rhamnosyltransferase
LSGSGNQPMLTVSVVSHRQAGLVRELLGDLDRLCEMPVEALVTINVPEPLPFEGGVFRFPVKILRNPARRGFGANHNAAFRESRGRFFCVLNPDIRLAKDPFPVLIDALADERVGVAAPLVKNGVGEIEDSARRFPTPAIILRKALGAKPGPDYAIGVKAVRADWIAGMFMVFRREVFERIGGFDERYFLYYEDVDLCARLHALGYDVVLDPSVPVVHEARRASHSDWRYRTLHLKSMLRFFLTTGRLASRRS